MAEYTYKRYWLAFKREIVRLVESGELSIGEARRRYGIGGSSAVQRWLKKYGTKVHTSKQMRVVIPEEVDRMDSLEEEKRATESTIDVASEHFGTDVKKLRHEGIAWAIKRRDEARQEQVKRIGLAVARQSTAKLSVGAICQGFAMSR